MFGKTSIIYLFILYFILIQAGCKSKPEVLRRDNESDSALLIDTTDTADNFSHQTSRRKKAAPDSIVGDTIWMDSYVSLNWYDTLSTSDFTVCTSVRADTCNYIIDTVKSSKGDRIAIGYNHYYELDFRKNNLNWFTISFNKKRDLATILDGTDLWLESNLDVFDNILFNAKFDQFVVEFKINSRSSFGLLYYMIFDTKGTIKFIGTANSWGGESPDGESFLTINGELFVTCYEVYNFQSSVSVTLSEYLAMAEFRAKNDTISEYIQIHGLRNLSNNYFLAIFNRYHDEPVYNAFILSTDTTVISRFSYYGIIEEMDAILLYAEDQRLNRSFLYDTDREKLICITTTENPQVRELSIKDMHEFSGESGTTQQYTMLDFGLYGSYEFYTSSADSTIYYKADKFK